MVPAKAEPVFSLPPGDLFFPQSKPEVATTTNTWLFQQQPKPAPPPSYPAPVPPASQVQQYPTVNLSDLYGFSFPFLRNAQQPVGGANTGGGAEVSNLAAPTEQPSGGAQFGTASMASCDDDLLPKFPSFSEVQSFGALDNISADEDLQALLGQSGISGEGAAVVNTMAQPPSSSSGPVVHMPNQVVQGGCGGTWMSYPNSILSLLQTEAAPMDNRAPNHAPGPAPRPVLDDLDELSSLDEDRLMSILSDNR